MKEILVYLIDLNEHEDLGYREINENTPDERFMDIAEKDGTVYTLKKFEADWNRESMIYNSFIRFIERETAN